MPGQQVTPRAVAELEGTGGGVHDVSYQERRQHSIEATALRTRVRRNRLPVDRDPRLITHDPRVVAGRNLIELPGLDQQLPAPTVTSRAVAPVDPARPDLLAVEQVGETLVARSGPGGSTPSCMSFAVIAQLGRGGCRGSACG
jgi:hypothetical protein